MIKLIECPRLWIRIRVRVQPICKVTGYVDECEVVIEYLSDGRCIEMDSLLSYIARYNHEKLTNEELTERIYRDLLEATNNATLRVKTICRYPNATIEISTEEDQSSR